MNAVNEMNTPVTRILESVKNLYLSTEELGLVTVWDAMAFHAGRRREEEIENQNPQSPTTKVYVMIEDHGPYIANAVESSTAIGGILLTHLHKVENLEAFFNQIKRETDRGEEGEAFLLSAWAVL